MRKKRNNSLIKSGLKFVNRNVLVAIEFVEKKDIMNIIEPQMDIIKRVLLQENALTGGIYKTRLLLKQLMKEMKMI